MIARVLAAALCAALSLTVARAEDPPAAEALQERVLVSFPFGQSPSSGLTVGTKGAIFGAGGALVYELYKDDQNVWRTRKIFDVPNTAITGVVQLGFAKGEIYGLSTFGATNCSRFSGPGCGFLFTLKPTSDPAVWTRSSFFEFPGDKGGRYPVGFAIQGDGSVVVSTREGGGSTNCGAASGEPNGCGTVMKLTRDGDRWKSVVVYRYQNGSDGAAPDVGPAIDPAGFAFQSVPRSGAATDPGEAPRDRCGALGRMKVGKETQKLLKVVREYVCAGKDGARSAGIAIFGDMLVGPDPAAEAAPDPATGLLTTAIGGGRTDLCASSGEDGCGVVFTLRRPKDGSYPWIKKTVHRFAGTDGDGPFGAWLTVGKTSYGVTRSGGACATSGGCGVVFSAKKTDEGWSYGGTVHRFAGGGADGRQPFDRLVEVDGKIFGTTRFGGVSDAGVVYMLSK